MKNNSIEYHRGFWAAIAKTHGWYKEPFYVQVWIDKDGNITDSVSTTALTMDYISHDDGDDDED